jgi:predicted alternative tryptophan synthase beta-subunit
MERIKILKDVALETAKEDEQHLNVFAFIGHGVINE